MKIENLKVGMVIKNYKELCKLLETKVKTGGAKQTQLDKLRCFCNYHKDGNKFIIDEIYKEPKSRKMNYKNYKCFKLEYKDWHKKGVYCIILKNNIYVGSTIAGFRKRFIGHYSEMQIPETNYMLHHGGVFDVLYYASNKDTEKDIRDKETYYINKFKNNKEWISVNIRNKAYVHNTSKKPKIKYKTVKFKVKQSEYEITIDFLKKQGYMK